jgi:hypothetical protein
MKFQGIQDFGTNPLVLNRIPHICPVCNQAEGQLENVGRWCGSQWSIPLASIAEQGGLFLCSSYGNGEMVVSLSPLPQWSIGIGCS